ncbi:Cyclin-P3-1 [Phytophthora citrophthora]|uniref:Cyclin-P3-1 n=1 Tax=Phytophthora citrophthora TaxID=4793 RepID=A0AAD9LPG5_9STRA|nr:Cyclin-P3-1 [Phytophthora citrophthora]
MTIMLDDTAESNDERGRAIVQTLAVVVESMVHASDRMPLGYYHKTKFEAFRAPGISVRDYLTRIHKYASCSPECFVLALVYMDRLHQMQGFVLTELNVHRVVITSVVLAAKFFDDHYFNNAYYAKVGGVPCPEMNELEVEYLLLINFSLHVSSETYARYYNELASHYMYTRVRNSSLPQSPFYQMRHFVAPDPQLEGQLVYVTESYPKVPPPQEHRRSHPVPLHHRQSQQLTPMHHRRTVEDGENGAVTAAGNSTAANGNGIACTKSSRASGQKRRSAVALGVNA